MKLKSTLLCLTLFALMSCNLNSEKASNGLITKESLNDFNTTYNSIKSTIETNPNLKILLELDHSKNAASAGLDLEETKIILFGNPKLGTPLMQNSRTIGIDLPQKIIVYKDANDKVYVAYNDPIYLIQRHNIENNDAIVKKISNALDAITTKATQKN